jgi:haloacid dehalogenase-like hydrolase
VEPLAIGAVSVVTDQAVEAALRQAIETTGVDVGVVADKGMAVAVPVGVDKASGLAAALVELELSPHNVVGVGNAVSDLGFLDRCECGAAVANAPSEVADRCDLVTSRAGPAGLVELIDQLVADDLAEVEPRLARRRLLLGHNDDGELAVPAYGANLVLAGPSGAGKSTLAAGLLERRRDQRYQFLVLDPEGDHADLAGVTHLGDRRNPPTGDQVVAALQEHPEQSVVANLLGRRLEDMAGFLRGL